jgi:hypothetical protein
MNKNLSLWSRPLCFSEEGEEGKVEMNEKKRRWDREMDWGHLQPTRLASLRCTKAKAARCNCENKRLLFSLSLDPILSPFSSSPQAHFSLCLSVFWPHSEIKKHPAQLARPIPPLLQKRISFSFLLRVKRIMAEQNERAVAASRSALAGLSRPLEEKEGEDLSLSLFFSLFLVPFSFLFFFSCKPPTKAISDQSPFKWSGKKQKQSLNIYQKEKAAAGRDIMRRKEYNTHYRRPARLHIQSRKIPLLLQHVDLDRECSSSSLPMGFDRLTAFGIS